MSKGRLVAASSTLSIFANQTSNNLTNKLFGFSNQLLFHVGNKDKYMR